MVMDMDVQGFDSPPRLMTCYVLAGAKWADVPSGPASIGHPRGVVAPCRHSPFLFEL